MTVILDTSALPYNLRFYLPLYADLLFESPIIRDGREYQMILRDILLAQVIAVEGCFLIRHEYHRQGGTVMFLLDIGCI